MIYNLVAKTSTVLTSHLLMPTLLMFTYMLQ